MGRFVEQLAVLGELFYKHKVLSLLGTMTFVYIGTYPSRWYIQKRTTETEEVAPDRLESAIAKMKEFDERKKAGQL